MTGFSCWPGYLGVVSGGVCLDLVDHHRLLTYLENCPIDPRKFRVQCCTCAELYFKEGGIPRTFGCPATDPAPWYNASDPPYLLDVASRFYGPEILSWAVSPVGFVESSSPRVAHRPRRGKLRIEAKIRLWGDGCDATLYGLEWFQRELECGTCDGLSLRLLRACDQTFDPNNPALTGGNWWRTINSARILVEPIPQEAAPPGTVSTCCRYREATVVIEAEDPCSYWVTPSVECVAAGPWRGPFDEDLFPGECRCGPLCPCGAITPSCEGPCLPVLADVRAFFNTVTVGCYCVPFSTCRKICAIPASATPGLSDAVMAFTVASMGGPTTNLRIWVWKADASPGPDVDWDRWRCTAPCTTIDIGALQTDDVLTIDGRSRTVSVRRQIETCDLIVTSKGQPLFWPTLNCSDSFWIGIEYDTYSRAPNLEVTTAVYPRECWTA